ncbi:MAG: diadenylate cyclase CdaA [bacterium]
MTKVLEWFSITQGLSVWQAVKMGAEIIIISVIFYYVILFMQRTRALFILRGLGVMLVIVAISYLLRLDTIFFLFRGVGVVAIVALIIVFQPELRRALEQIGQRGFWTRSFAGLEKEDIIKLIHNVIMTLEDLAITKMGALVVIEQETQLDEYAASGTHVGGAVTPELLKTIFFPHTFLHDGAVIIRGNKILAAGCFLPLSENPNLLQDVGSRHRAALGITEITDSIALCVSEETGKLSLAHQGKLIRDIRPDALRELLYSICLPQGTSFSSLLGVRVEKKAD